jgi:hypothetical protein
MPRRLLRSAIALTLCLALASCGGSDGGPSGPADSTPPTITQVSVSEGADDIGLIERISVTFSEPMDASTITDTTVFVTGRSATGHVEYDAATRTASVIPDTLYASETPHIFVVTDEVTDDSGNGLSEPDTTSFETGPFGCDYLMDYLEPNNEVGDGAVVEVDKLYRTLSVCGQNSDYYHFTLEDPAMVTATTVLRHCAEDESWGIYFMRTNGDHYATRGVGADPGDTTTFRFSFLPGTYALWLFGYDDPVYVLYDLELVTSEPCPDDEYEDNDFMDEAQPVAPGLTTDLGGCYLDADYYTFDVEAGQVVTLTATQHPHEGSVHSRMRIYDPSGASNGDDEDSLENSIERTIEQSGTCTVMVQFWEDIVYDLEIAIDG